MDEWKKAAVNAATDSHVPFRAFFCGGKMNCAFFFGTKKIAIHVSKTKLNCTGRGEISVSRQRRNAVASHSRCTVPVQYLA